MVGEAEAELEIMRMRRERDLLPSEEMSKESHEEPWMSFARRECFFKGMVIGRRWGELREEAYRFHEALEREEEHGKSIPFLTPSHEIREQLVRELGRLETLIKENNCEAPSARDERLKRLKVFIEGVQKPNDAHSVRSLINAEYDQVI